MHNDTKFTIEGIMLLQCSRHYGLSSSLFSAVQRLALLCYTSHPCGYSSAPLRAFHFPLSEAAVLLNIPSSQVSEALHYGALFGLLQGVVLSPLHIEFTLNPYHRRDLFFARLRLLLRESTPAV